ncbi:MAG: hypothetical protein HKN94_10805 [Acidimicrobiales bacterium]|nr:hypothetical protein [Acidimicrobiales bacterium]RZV47713.1 MAG: hypothetical protein EX269_04125 [Acidimicrobiales bacterium]
MLRRVLSCVQNRASWPVVLGLLAAAGVLTFAMNGTDLPFSTPTIEDHSGGLRILDMQFSYGPEEANHLFEALGSEGRRSYLMLHLMPDLLFPISYALAFACTAAWFLVRLLPLDHPLQWLGLTPLIAGVADIGENLSIVVANLSYPSRLDWLTQTASVLTKIKWGLMPIGGVLLTIMLVLWLKNGKPKSNVWAGGR